ncbi:MAG: formate/nitrite transporter family protein [Firmicutes bacterium]|nr:formate/nitrite transporter family protein [Bacillota bacterium]MDD7602554.1 formate/nitrite transporter family protein [Bacillota bacterium]MDY5856817.1 formate/nitrite transporter family protein [Anaerovoracaceae bacterium]
MGNGLKTFLYGVAAGICIAIGGTVFLSVENKVIGALFFTVGLFTICTFGLNLFTGKVCYLFENDRRYALQLIPIWLGNLAGTWLTAMLLQQTRIAGISARAAEMCESKLNDSLLSIFILSVFCNFLIFIAVDGFRNNPHEVGKYLALFFGVMVFILCGFEHCVANMFYISMAGAWSGRALLFLLVNTAGNAAGGWILPLLRKIK